MLEKTYNKGNWSGEEIEVKINEDKNILHIFEERFKVKYDETGAIIVGLDDYKNMKLLGVEDNGMWSVFDKGQTVTRNSEDIYEAITQVLCSLI